MNKAEFIKKWRPFGIVGHEEFKKDITSLMQLLGKDEAKAKASKLYSNLDLPVTHLERKSAFMDCYVWFTQHREQPEAVKELHDYEHLWCKKCKKNTDWVDGECSICNPQSEPEQPDQLPDVGKVMLEPLTIEQQEVAAEASQIISDHFWELDEQSKPEQPEAKQTIPKYKFPMPKSVLDLIRDQAKPQQPDDGWVRVEDRLPIVGEHVIAYDGRGNSVDFATMDGKGEFVDFAQYRWRGITHWRPLPSPPKNEKP